jgi:membrane dipeptidase
MGWIDDQQATRLGLDDQTVQLHRRCVGVDLHVDALLTQRFFGVDLREEHSAGALWKLRSLPFDLARGVLGALGYQSPFYNHADLPRLRRGGYGLVALGLHYWPRQTERGYAEVHRQLDVFAQLVRDGQLTLASRPEDVRRAAAEGKLAAFCGLEGAHGLGAGGRDNEARRLARVAELHQRGVRYITLAHFSRNDAAAHCFGPGSVGPDDDDPGLSLFGRRLVEEMNRVGMLVDVAHVSPRGVLDVCELSDKPVLATHTGLAGVDPERRDKARTRNISDEALRAIAATGGVVGVIFAPQFLSGDADGLSAVVRHLQHGARVLEQAGFDPAAHLAIGSDFDGWIATIPDELEDAADAPLLTRAMLEAGFDERLIEGIWGEAFLGAWERALA